MHVIYEERNTFDENSRIVPLRERETGLHIMADSLLAAFRNLWSKIYLVKSVFRMTLNIIFRYTYVFCRVNGVYPLDIRFVFVVHLYVDCCCFWRRCSFDDWSIYIGYPVCFCCFSVRGLLLLFLTTMLVRWLKYVY